MGFVSTLLNLRQLGGVRQWRLPQFAERFQQAGYSVLLYDNRHWGDSDGLPRQHSNPFDQLTDYHDAFNYVCSLPSIDRSRVVYWGTSFSGGNVVYAAAIDKRIKAAIVQCSSVSGQVRAEVFKDRLLGALDGRALVSNGQPEPQVPLIAGSREAAIKEDEPVMFPDVHAYDELAPMHDLHNWTNSLTTATQLYMALSEPQAVIHRISPTPLLMIVPENDVTVKTTSQLAAFEKANEPKHLVIINGAGHFDIYSGEFFEENIAAQLGFLERAFS